MYTQRIDNDIQAFLHLGCHFWQSKKRLERTKKFLQLGTAFYIILLLLMSTFDNLDLAMVVQLGAIGVGMTACGSGAAKVSCGH